MGDPGRSMTHKHKVETHSLLDALSLLRSFSLRKHPFDGTPQTPSGSCARARLGVVEEAAALLGIPAVLDGVLGPARESARDLIPAITEDRLERHEQEVFGRRPGRLHQVRVQVILPAPVQK